MVKFRVIKKFLKIITLICIITPLLLIVSIPVVNNFIAWSIKKELKDTPLPANTEICETVSKAGKLTGNGNGMQFLGAILIKTQLSLGELNEYYSQYGDSEWSYVIEPQDGAKITVIDHGNLSFSSMYNVSDFDGYYIIYSWGNSNYTLSDFDIRGH